jgi:hypothetical protein
MGFNGRAVVVRSIRSSPLSSRHQTKTPTVSARHPERSRRTRAKQQARENRRRFGGTGKRGTFVASLQATIRN